MSQENKELRELAKSHNVPFWRIAAELGVSESTITRWLRVPLNLERKKSILDAITHLIKEVE